VMAGLSSNRQYKPLILLWWARQDSNLQPDRYERPALTIELQAPANGRTAKRLRQMDYMAHVHPAMPDAAITNFGFSEFRLTAG
jgi:hypothetical protein